MKEITEENLWFHHNEKDPSPIKWYIQVAATHEFDPEVEVLREKYGHLTVMEKGYDESNRYGWFTVFAIPLHAYLCIYPQQADNATKVQQKVIPKLANRFQGMARNGVVKK